MRTMNTIIKSFSVVAITILTISVSSCNKCSNCTYTFEDIADSTITEEVCNSGRIYKNQIETYEANGWICE